MTSYEPYPSVTIDQTITIPDSTLSNIRIFYGRQDVLEQPAPGYANIDFWTDGNTPLDIELSDSVSISIDKGTTGTAVIFTGTVSDIQVSFDAYGSEGSIARYAITAVGPLAQLNKRLSGLHNFNEEKDGDRIYHILYDAFVTTWDEIIGTTSWTDAPNTISWADYDATSEALIVNISTDVDQPGQYFLVAYNDGEINALTLAQDAANSGRGVLWEAADGSIHYDDYAARSLNPEFVLTADDILANGLSVDAQWGEIYNYITVEYATGSSYDEDITSQQLYGRLSGSKTTSLKHAADALTQAEDYVKSRAYGRMYPTEVTVPLHSPTVSDATRDQMADIYNGLYITSVDLPPVMGGELKSFVEGWQWSLTRYTADLTLYLSQYSETYTSEIWYQVLPTIDWATYNNSITWENA